MALPNIFSATVANEVIGRIKSISNSAQPQWGKMNAAQMLAHCNVTYEMVYTDIHKKPSCMGKFFLKFFVKNLVTNETPYKANSRTAPQFLITDAKEIEQERTRLIDYINQTQQLGELHFQGKQSHSFGPLNTSEWNNMFYKHLDHHLKQFGV